MPLQVGSVRPNAENINYVLAGLRRIRLGGDSLGIKENSAAVRAPPRMTIARRMSRQATPASAIIIDDKDVIFAAYVCRENNLVTSRRPGRTDALQVG